MNTNTFPPFGYNDNNFNRQYIPSNIMPNYHKNNNPMFFGKNGNPSNNFNSLSTNTQQMMNNLPYMSDYNNSFLTPHTIIEPIDYINQNNLNITSNLSAADGTETLPA